MLQLLDKSLVVPPRLLRHRKISGHLQQMLLIFFVMAVTNEAS